MGLKPGDLLIDYSYSRPSLKQAAQSGAKGIIRYTAGAASLPSSPSFHLNQGKLITRPEFDAAVGLGLDVIANDEWYESRITEGKAAGAADGAAAGQTWRAVGLAKGATIYSSWDQSPSPSKYLKVAAYVRAYRKALKGRYDIDAYGGTGFLKWALRNGLIRYGWRPNAGSWSGDGLPYQPDTSTAVKRAALVKLALKKTPAHIWQTGNYWFGKSADENLILRVPVGSHLEALHAADKPKPPPAVPPATPPSTEDLTLTPEDKQYLDAKFDAVIAALRGALSDSKGKAHTLRFWLSRLSGKKIDA